MVPQTEMPRYQSHKKVWALKIKEITFGDPYAKVHKHPAIITPEENEYAPFEVDAEYVTKHQPEVGGYFVQYDDGYKSFSPAKAFEDGYTRL